MKTIISLILALFLVSCGSDEADQPEDRTPPKPRTNEDPSSYMHEKPIYPEVVCKKATGMDDEEVTVCRYKTSEETENNE